MIAEASLALWLLSWGYAVYLTIPSFVRDVLRTEGEVQVGDVVLCLGLVFVLLFVAPLVGALDIFSRLNKAKFWHKTVYRRQDTES